MTSTNSTATTVLRTIHIPAIGTHWLEQGGIYGGIQRSTDGSPDYHLIISPKETEIEANNWEACIHAAKNIASEFDDWQLMDHRESLLAYVNAREQFSLRKCYWTATQDESGPDYAYIQDFDDGGQHWNRKSNEYLARAVRRVLIIQ